MNTIVMCTNQSCKFNEAGEICGKDKIEIVPVKSVLNYIHQDCLFCESFKCNELPKEDNTEISR